MSFVRISSLALVLGSSAWLAGCSASALPTDGEGLSGGSAESVGAADQALGSDPPPIVLQPDAASGKDALINDYGPSANYGDHIVLSAGAWTMSGTPMVQRGLLSFDLSSIPAGSVVRSAKLSLHADTVTALYGQGIFNGLPLGHSDLSGTNEVLVRRVTSKWDEHTVTWDTQPTTTESNQIVLATSTSPTQDYLDQDVTALVQDMINNPAESDGFMLALQTEAYYRELSFVSSDGASADLHPKLEIQLAGSGSNLRNAVCHADFLIYKVDGPKVWFQDTSFTSNGPDAGFWQPLPGVSVPRDPNDPLFFYDYGAAGKYTACFTVQGSTSTSSCQDTDCVDLTLSSSGSCAFGSYNKCNRECRADRRDCRQDCRADKRSCKDDCKGLSGAAKRECKRDCRHDKKECKELCTTIKGACTDSCQQTCLPQ